MRFRWTFAACLLAFGVTAPLRAQQDTVARGVRVRLIYPSDVPPGVVVLPIAGPAGDSVQTIIQRDLGFGDRVTVITIPDSMAAAIRGSVGAAGAGKPMNYGVFKAINALAVVQITPTDRGLHVALHDVTNAKVIDVSEFELPSDTLSRNWRLAVHRVSDEVERWVTGVQGIAATRVAYIQDHAVHIVDSDGADDITIPMAGAGLSPAWSPAGDAIAYATFGENSRIVVYNLRTGESHAFGARRNTNVSTPTFSPDGSRVVYTVASEYGSDLYSSSVTGTSVIRVTAGGGTDNSQPSFSPDGLRLAFTSSRAGPPEIYIMDADGTNADIFTTYGFGPQNYRSDPDWSPDGLSIAYQSYVPDGSGIFQVFTMSLRDRVPRQLTSDARNEDPSWAPDGRHLVFTSSRGGTRQLWVMDTQMGTMRQLTHGASEARLGAWSPRGVQ